MIRYTYIYYFPLVMNLLRSSASSSESSGHNLANPPFKVNAVVFLIPYKPINDSIFGKEYFFCFSTYSNCLNLVLLWSKCMLLFQSSAVMNPSLLLSNNLNN